MTSRTSPLGGVTSFTFDSFGRVLTQIDPDPDGSGAQSAGVTNYEYSAAGLSKITDALSHAKTLVRYGQGRVTSMTDAQSNVTSYAYDYYSNLLSQTDPDPDGTGPLARPVTTFGYDVANRLVLKADPLGGNTGYARLRRNSASITLLI